MFSIVLDGDNVMPAVFDFDQQLVRQFRPRLKFHVQAKQAKLHVMTLREPFDWADDRGAIPREFFDSVDEHNVRAVLHSPRLKAYRIKTPRGASECPG
jgi:hypothetical protein